MNHTHRIVEEAIIKRVQCWEKKVHDDTAIMQSCDTGFRDSWDLMH